MHVLHRCEIANLLILTETDGGMHFRGDEGEIGSFGMKSLSESFNMHRGRGGYLGSRLVHHDEIFQQPAVDKLLSVT